MNAIASLGTFQRSRHADQHETQFFPWTECAPTQLSIDHLRNDAQSSRIFIPKSAECERLSLKQKPFGRNENLGPTLHLPLEAGNLCLFPLETTFDAVFLQRMLIIHYEYI